MKVIDIKPYEILKKYVQKKEDASILITFFENKAEEKIIQKKYFFTKYDKIELIKESKETKSDMKEWNFLFWIGQIGVGIVMFLCMMYNYRVLNFSNSSINKQ